MLLYMQKHTQSAKCLIKNAAGRKFTMLQAYQGYFEKGRFYTAGQAFSIPERRQVILTILDSTQDETKIKSINNVHEEQERRKEWIKRLDAAIDLSLEEEFPDVVRSTPMHEPVNLS